MLERLQRLEVNIRELQRFRQTYTREDVRRDPHLEWALRYGLLEAVQIVIDVSCHVVSRHNLGLPATYAECVDRLHRAGYLDDRLANTLSGMVGLRNILVHEYVSVDHERLYELLDRLDDLRWFAQQIEPYTR
ncbi:MAG: type VII toxin-antitoxin system HepT family RNase toxin [Roseiflexus sp.]